MGRDRHVARPAPGVRSDSIPRPWGKLAFVNLYRAEWYPSSHGGKAAAPSGSGGGANRPAEEERLDVPYLASEKGGPDQRTASLSKSAVIVEPAFDAAVIVARSSAADAGGADDADTRNDDEAATDLETKPRRPVVATDGGEGRSTGEAVSAVATTANAAAARAT